MQIKWNERDKTGKWFSFLPMSERKEIIFSFRKFLFLMYTAGGQIQGWLGMNSFIRFFSFYFARIRCQEGKKNGWLEERGTDGEKVIHMHIGGILWEWKWERYTINTEYFSFSFTEWQKGYTQLCTACVSFWDGQAEKSLDLSRKEKKQIVFIHMMWIVVNKFVNNVNKYSKWLIFLTFFVNKIVKLLCRQYFSFKRVHIFYIIESKGSWKLCKI